MTAEVNDLQRLININIAKHDNKNSPSSWNKTTNWQTGRTDAVDPVGVQQLISKNSEKFEAGFTDL